MVLCYISRYAYPSLSKEGNRRAPFLVGVSDCTLPASIQGSSRSFSFSCPRIQIHLGNGTTACLRNILSVMILGRMVCIKNIYCIKTVHNFSFIQRIKFHTLSPSKSTEGIEVSKTFISITCLRVQHLLSSPSTCRLLLAMLICTALSTSHLQHLLPSCLNREAQHCDECRQEQTTTDEHRSAGIGIGNVGSDDGCAKSSDTIQHACNSSAGSSVWSWEDLGCIGVENTFKILALDHPEKWANLYLPYMIFWKNASRDEKASW